MPNYRSARPSIELDDPSVVQYLKEIDQYPLLSRDEENELSRKAKKGDEKAFHDLAESNLRFVVRVALRYQNMGVPLLDLIQAGNEGLLRTIPKYDEKRGVKFISYAVSWIRQSILETLAFQARYAKVPTNVIVDLRKIIRYISEFEQESGREPSVEEIAGKFRFSEKKVMSRLRLLEPTVSLYSPVFHEGGGNGKDGKRLEDVIYNEEEPTPEEVAHDSMMGDTIMEELNRLSRRERKAIIEYFGLFGEQKKTLEDIGKDFGVTRERVRQIREEGTDKLREPKVARRLKPYF